MKTLMAALLLAGFCRAPLRAQTEDLSKNYSDAVSQWLDGRPEDAAGALKYVVYRSSDQALTMAALKDLAALLAQEGNNGEALAYLAKGEILAPEDFFVHFEKGWNLLGLEKYQDARSSFEKALTLTADQDLASQARLGMSMAEAELGGPAAAIEDLQSVYGRYPYLLSPAAQLISENLVRLKKRPYALNFIKDALNYDPRNIQAEIDLAGLYDDSDYQTQAWQTYYTLSDLDPEDGYFAAREKKFRKYVKGKLDDLLYWARLAWPAHKDPVPQTGAKIKLALYADKNGVPALVKSFRFIPVSDFSIIDTRLGAVATGKGGMQWTIDYDETNRIYEVRDSMNAVAHTTRNGIRIVPRTPGSVILIKNPDLGERHGVNRSDKEISGELLAMARGKGFWLIDETALETLVSPVSAYLAGDSRLPEHLKAVAVVVRTRLTRLARQLSHDSREYNLCDSAHCLPFMGLQSENAVSARASADTAGETLTTGGALAPAALHRACGGFTRAGANDGGRPLPKLTPFSLYDYTLRAPPDGLLCLAEDKTESSDVYWTLLLQPRWIEDRVNRIKKVGYIKSIVPLGRGADGKVRAVRITGTAGSAVVEGSDEISFVLGAGAVRSSFFSIRPVFRGKYPRFFLLRGVGTGDGDGLCLLGARGMAKSLGSKYRDILSHYFPLYKVGKTR